MSDDKQFVQQLCASVWWLVLLRGITVLVLGGFLIAKPGLTAVVLMQFLGAYFLVDGVFAIIHSIQGRKHMQGWGWGLIMGGLEILTGLMIFSQPVLSTILTAEWLVYCVAFMSILLGVLGITTGIRVRRDVKGEWAMIAGGVAAILFGVLLFMNPLASAAVYLVVMGVLGVVAGLVQIFAAFQLRSIGKKLGQPEGDPA